MKRFLMMTALAVGLCAPAFAHDGVHVEDPYARASTAMSQSGAAFMRLVNHSQQDIRLIDAQSDIAQRVELHTHLQDAAGVMRMVEVKDGFVIPAGAEHLLQRGGDHVMFLGLTRPLAQGDEFTLTLTFDNGEVVEVVVPVDLERPAEPAGHGAMHGHKH
jgi:periplasmic copper chaperone A